MNLLLAMAMLSGDTQAASADRADLTAEQLVDRYYLSASHITDPAEQRDLIDAIRLMANSASRSIAAGGNLTALEHRPALLRLDVSRLAWDPLQWRKVISRNPYGGPNPLVLRADWLLLELADAQQSDAYYRLLLGSVPKTRDEILAALGVVSRPEFYFGLIEGQSGVSKQGVRWIESRPTINRAYAWGTRDVLTVTRDRDPLEHPAGDFAHQGEEWIIGLPKLSLASGQRGALQAYFLADGAGRVVFRAPVDLVEDHTRFRGLSEIRVPGSCVQCHSRGLNDFTQNALRQAIRQGVDPYAAAGAAQQIEAFHLGDLSRSVARAQEDYATAVAELTGHQDPQEAAAAFRRAVGRYTASVDLTRAAEELGVLPADLRLALDPTRAGAVPARAALLAAGGQIRRETFIELFGTLQTLIANSKGITHAVRSAGYRDRRSDRANHPGPVPEPAASGAPQPGGDRGTQPGAVFRRDAGTSRRDPGRAGRAAATDRRAAATRRPTTRRTGGRGYRGGRVR